MASHSLVATAPLGGFHLDLGGTEIAAITDRALVSAAVPLGGESAFAAALTSAYGVTRPETGQSAVTKDGGTRIMGMQPDQVFILFDYSEDTSPAATVSDALGDGAYMADQSDSWAMLRLSGANARLALERICMLDLTDAAFPDGRVARTVMEHLAVIVQRDGAESFLLMSPRSSAPAFLHAVETSARNLD